MSTWYYFAFFLFNFDNVIENSVFERHVNLKGVISTGDYDRIKLRSVGVPAGEFYVRTQHLEPRFLKWKQVKSTFDLPVPLHYKVLITELRLRAFYIGKVKLPKVQTFAFIRENLSFRPTRKENVLYLKFKLISP